ncbi:hypothetical protein WA577_004194, partial [Blastocystis sp. JDR]
PIPVPFFSQKTSVGDEQYYIAVSVYSNLLHILVTNDGKPGNCIQFIPHAQFGSDPTQQYKIQSLLGELTPLHELVIKQIASCATISSYAIPFLCHLKLSPQLRREDLTLLIHSIRTFIDSHQDVIKSCYQ